MADGIVPYEGNEPYIFVSYSSMDRETVIPIITKIHKAGYRVWWYEKGIEGGDLWDKTVSSHVKNCGCFLAFLSENYVNSEECNDELGLAQSKHKGKLPIYLEEVDLPDGMDMHLQRVQALTWYLYDEKSLFYEKLLGSTQLVTCLDTQKKAIMDAKGIDYSSGKAMIGEYEIVDKIKAQKYESVEGDYKFIGKKSGKYIPTYVYIRPLNSEQDYFQKVFSERDIDVQDFFQNMKTSNHIIKGFEIPTQADNVRYLAYEIQENTKTLDQLEMDAISSRNLLDIILQIAQGLADLTIDKINIHHRGIRPTCIFVTPEADGYEAKLGCFETAKIEYITNPVATVLPYMLESQRESKFVHPKLLDRTDVTGAEWEKGDVYSLAAVLLNCLHEEAVANGTMDCSVLMDYYSDDFYDSINMILNSGSIKMIPTMKEFCSVLTKEQENLSTSG